MSLLCGRLRSSNLFGTVMPWDCCCTFERFNHQNRRRFCFGGTFSLARRPPTSAEPIRPQSSLEASPLRNIRRSFSCLAWLAAWIACPESEANNSPSGSWNSGQECTFSTCLVTPTTSSTIAVSCQKIRCSCPNRLRERFCCAGSATPSTQKHL